MTTTQKLILLHNKLSRNLYNRQSIENMMPAGTAKESQLRELDEQYYGDMKEANNLAPQPSINMKIETNGKPY